MPNLDPLDRAILDALRRDARIQTSALARAVGVSRTTAQSRLARLEARGVITGYVALTAEEFEPGAIRATVLLQAEPRRTAAIVARLTRMAEVESLSTTAGRFDLTMTLVAPDTARLDAALDTVGALDGVRGMESLVHLTVKLDRRR